MKKIAMHGFGRIGRSTLRVALKEGLFTPVSISDIKDAPTLAALFEVDTNYPRWHEEVSGAADKITIGGRAIQFFDTTQSLPDWAALGVDLVIDCTGRATTRAGAQAHLARGAKRVLVSAASKTLQDCDAVLLPGINFDQYDAQKHHIISMASCTTNALAPVVKVLMENFGIQAGFFSTVHAYTNTQSLTDQPMRDRRNSWAAAENLIPSSSGAAKALKFIWPDLKITGKAYRVPVRTGSIAEVNVIVGRLYQRRRSQRRFPQGCCDCAAQRHYGCARRGMGLLAHRGRPAFFHHRPAADTGDGRYVGLGGSLVRQRNGLFNPPGRDGCPTGAVRP